MQTPKLGQPGAGQDWLCHCCHSGGQAAAQLHARAMLGPGPGPPHRNLELAGRAVVCTANNQTFKSLTKPSAGPPVREVQAQHRCLHPRQGEIDWLSPGLTLSPCQEFGLKNFSLSLFPCQEFGLKNLRTIHRLDRLTSGLLMFGRNPRKAREMEQQIRNRQVVLRFSLLPSYAISPPPTLPYMSAFYFFFVISCVLPLSHRC